MPEENTATTTGTETNEAGSEQTLTVTDAELQELRADSIRFKKTEQMAKAYGYEEVDEFLEDAEIAFNEATAESESSDGTTTTQKKPDVIVKQTAKTEGQTVTQAQPVADVATQKLARDGFLKAEFLEYQMGQNALPEADRSPFEKKELNKFLNDNTNVALAGSLVKSGKYDNFYEAANFILSIQGGGKNLIKKGADTAAAMARGEANADIGTTKKVVDTGVDERTWQEKEADNIAPDDKYEPPIA